MTRHHHLGARSLLQCAGAQEVSALRSDRTGARRFAGHALQPGASRIKTFELRDGARELLACEPVANSSRARVSGVRQPHSGRPDRTYRTRARLSDATPDEPPLRFTLRGFVSRPQVQKNNRNSIYIFVNRRLIRDKLLLHAISAAYYNLMPGQNFPFALLFLGLRPGGGGCECAPFEDGGALPPADFCA